MSNVADGKAYREGNALAGLHAEGQVILRTASKAAVIDLLRKVK